MGADFGKGKLKGQIHKEHPSGAKAHTYFEALTARLKPCPDAYGRIEWIYFLTACEEPASCFFSIRARIAVIV